MVSTPIDKVEDINQRRDTPPRLRGKVRPPNQEGRKMLVVKTVAVIFAVTFIMRFFTRRRKFRQLISAMLFFTLCWFVGSLADAGVNGAAGMSMFSLMCTIAFTLWWTRGTAKDGSRRGNYHMPRRVKQEEYLPESLPRTNNGSGGIFSALWGRIHTPTQEVIGTYDVSVDYHYPQMEEVEAQKVANLNKGY